VTAAREHGLDQWLAALRDRHRSSLTSAEFFKALRALSARYVERRTTLSQQSPLDSAGKRAAFAAFYAPLHFLTVREVVRALRGFSTGADLVVDLGCGTGAASAAVALEQTRRPDLGGVDLHPWAVAETRWTWKQLGLHGTVRRQNLVTAAEQLIKSRRKRPSPQTTVVLAWSVNELPAHDRRRLLPILLELSERDANVLVIEPLARSTVPWWDEWARAIVAAHGRADEWRFDIALPPELAALDEAAGFQRETLGARTLTLT
jgi:hypothetical protein